MSNLTEGKQALRDGDFVLAQEKLTKALDNRPDDSELWWCLMLCKCNYRNDEELERELAAKFTAAAEAGDKAPPSPFDSAYCKNALKYATNTRRRDFVDRVSARLSDIWESVRGKGLKTPKVRELKPRERINGRGAAAYAMLALAFIGAVMGVYGVGTVTIWAVWTGFVCMVMFILIAFVLRHLAKRAGREPKAIMTIAVSIFAVLAIGLIIAGTVTANKYVVILASVMLAVVAGFGVFGVLYKMRREKKSGGDNNGSKVKSVRADYDRANLSVPDAADRSKATRRLKDSDYEDTFD